MEATAGSGLGSFDDLPRNVKVAAHQFFEVLSLPFFLPMVGRGEVGLGARCLAYELKEFAGGLCPFVSG